MTGTINGMFGYLARFKTIYSGSNGATFNLPKPINGCLFVMIIERNTGTGSSNGYVMIKHNPNDNSVALIGQNGAGAIRSIEWNSTLNTIDLTVGSYVCGIVIG